MLLVCVCSLDFFTPPFAISVAYATYLQLLSIFVFTMKNK